MESQFRDKRLGLAQAGASRDLPDSTSLVVNAPTAISKPDVAYRGSEEEAGRSVVQKTQSSHPHAPAALLKQMNATAEGFCAVKEEPKKRVSKEESV
jgi:hypothetical protein